MYEKITITIHEEVLRQLDKKVKKLIYKNRSAAIEHYIVLGLETEKPEG